MGLQQGNHNVGDYSTDFCTKASLCKWISEALMDAFLNGLLMLFP